MKLLLSGLKNVIQLLLLLLGFLSCHTALAAVGFSVTPSTVGQTYVGIINLLITGLTNGESVVVQKFLDVNTNGVMDGEDFLWQQFQLTDGQASVIGGVTNLNVPGDADPTAGKITAQALFLNDDPGLNVIGRYAYKLSSPTGHFPPITNSFTVTNTAYAQSLTGDVTNNGTNVPNTIVLVFNAPQPGEDGPGWIVASTVANNSGSYDVKLPTGKYVTAALKSNYLANLAATPFSLTSGARVTNHIVLTNTSRTISGRLADAANPAINLPGLFLHAVNSPLAAAGTTDANGNFVLSVGPGHWNVMANGVETHGYVIVDQAVQVDTTTGDVSGLVITFPKATALFYGSVQDDQNHRLAGVFVSSADRREFFKSNAFTDNNGDYVAGALSDSAWSVQVDNDQPTVTNYLFSPGLYGMNLCADQATRQDFIALLASHHITGRLQDDQGNPLVNVGIYSYAYIGGQSYNSETATDAGGNYSLKVVNGTWMVDVESGGGHSVNSDFLPPLSQAIDIANNDGVLNFTAQIAPNHITGRVKDDANHPFANVDVNAYANINGTGYSLWTSTDTNGSYSVGVVNGSWNVRVDCGSLTGLGYQCIDGQTVTIANGNGTANFTVAFCGLQIATPSPLADGAVDFDYEAQFQASGCDNNFNWSTSDCADVPSGLTLWPDGTFGGVPDTPGTYRFPVHVQDSFGHTADKTFTLTIRGAAPDSPFLSEPAIPAHEQFSFILTGVAGQNYTIQKSTNLSSPNWMFLFVTNSLTDDSFLVVDPLATDHHAIYRAVVGP